MSNSNFRATLYGLFNISDDYPWHYPAAFVVIFIGIIFCVVEILRQVRYMPKERTKIKKPTLFELPPDKKNLLTGEKNNAKKLMDKIYKAKSKEQILDIMKTVGANKMFVKGGKGANTGELCTKDDIISTSNDDNKPQTHQDTKGKFSKFRRNKKQKFNKGKRYLKDKFNKGTEIKEKIGKNIGKFKEKVKRKFYKGKAKNAKKNIDKGIEEVKDYIDEGKDNVKEEFVDAKKNIDNGMEEVKENIDKGYVKEKLYDAKDNLDRGIEGMKEYIDEGKEYMKEGLVNAKENIEEGIEEVKENINKDN